MKIVLKIEKFYCPELKEGSKLTSKTVEEKEDHRGVPGKNSSYKTTSLHPTLTITLVNFFSVHSHLFFSFFLSFLFMLDPPSQFLFPEMHAVMKMAKFVKPAKLISL